VIRIFNVATMRRFNMRISIYYIVVMLKRGKVMDDLACPNITGDTNSLNVYEWSYIILVDCFLLSIVERGFAAFSYGLFRNDGAPAGI